MNVGKQLRFKIKKKKKDKNRFRKYLLKKHVRYSTNAVYKYPFNIGEILTALNLPIKWRVLHFFFRVVFENFDYNDMRLQLKCIMCYARIDRRNRLDTNNLYLIPSCIDRNLCSIIVISDMLNAVSYSD